MGTKTIKRFNYKMVFELIEKSLIEEGSRNKPIAEVKSELFRYNKRRLTLTDEKCFEKLIMTAFYSGFRAQTVKEKELTIKEHFPSWKVVSEYTEKDIENIMSDLGMIKKISKIKGCVDNAVEFKKIVDMYGSFGKYVDKFKAKDSFENQMLFKEDLQTRFSYLGETTVYHFMKELGIPVLKPDRVIMRIFKRLGLVENKLQFLKANVRGKQFAQATEHPIRYIDIVFAAYGQDATKDLGVNRGICLKDNPRCNLCYAKPYCHYFQEHGMPS